MGKPGFWVFQKRVVGQIDTMFGVRGFAGILALLAPGWACMHGAEGAYRVGLATGSGREELAGLQMAVMSVEAAGQEVVVRLGYRNEAEKPWVGRIAAPQGLVRLQAAGSAGELEATSVDERLAEPFLEGGLRPGTLRMGTVRFRLAEAATSDWLRPGRPLTLTLPPFAPVTFALDEAKRFEPVELQAERRRVGQSFSMEPLAEGVAPFPLRVVEFQVADGRIHFEVVARNATRFPLRWSGRLGLREMRLLTEEAELLEPVQVEGQLADGLVPEGAVWEPGVEHRGRVAFPLPHAHAAHAVSLLLPGYEPLSLVHDAGQRSWLVVKRAVTEEVATLGVQAAALREEGRRFESLAAFWAEQGRRLRNRDQAGFLAGFTTANGVRAARAQGLAGLVRVPVSWIEFEVPPLQKVEEQNGKVSGLLVEMRCLLAGLPRENAFVTPWGCDLERVEGGQGWRVIRCEPVGRVPFWERGFTELVSTEHFLVFYQLTAEEGAKRARLAGEQLEKAWQRLQKTPLKEHLGRRYAAFVIPQKEDFRALTGRDAGTFSGASSAAYAMRGGELRVLNQAMYVNDSHFSSLQRWWGKPDRLLTIQHELVHLALAEVTRPWTPAWLVEGVATFYAGQFDSFAREALRQRLPQGRVLAHLSQVPYVGAGTASADEVRTQYQYSAAAVRWISREWGEERLLALYSAFAGMKPRVWQNPEPGKAMEEREAEPPDMREGRLALAEEAIRRWLPGWGLDQVDAAVRLGLQR